MQTGQKPGSHGIFPARPVGACAICKRYSLDIRAFFILSGLGAARAAAVLDEYALFSRGIHRFFPPPEMKKDFRKGYSLGGEDVLY